MIKWSVPPASKETRWQKFTKQPHQMFFFSAIIFAVTIMSISFMGFVGFVGVDFSLLHGVGLIYGVFLNAFLGFLLTVIPRYTQGKTISRVDYVRLWSLYQVSMMLLLVFGQLGLVAISVSLAYAGYILLTTIYYSNNNRQHESLWLAFSLVIASIVLIVSMFAKIDLIWFTLWFVVLPIVFIVASRMIPSFYSVYFQTPLQSNSVSFVAFSVVLMWTIGLSKDLPQILLILSLIMFLHLLVYFTKQDIYKKAPPIVWVLGVGFLWFPVGFLAMIIETFYFNSLKMSYHIFLLGFVLTLLIGFGTRVILGHSGRAIVADAMAVSLFVLTQVIVVLRVFASILFISNAHYFIYIIHLSFVLWIVLFLVWSARYGKILLGD